MRFHLVTYYFTKTAHAHAQTAPPPLRRRLFHLPNQQWRASHHRHRFIPPTRLSQSRSYTSKPSNSGSGFLSWYLGMLQSRPIVTKCISTSIIFAAADISSQFITREPNDAWDATRTLRVAGIGMVVVGPAQHLWFNFVGRLLPKRDLITTFKKMGMGQLFYGPVINGAFFSFNASLQGESGNEIAARLKRDLIPTMLNGLMYWPACDFFTYKVIPVHLQPLFNSTFSYFWTIYLTYMASTAKAVPA